MSVTAKPVSDEPARSRTQAPTTTNRKFEPKGPRRFIRATLRKGERSSFHSCPNCGSSVYWRADIRPDHYGIAVGCFADPGFPIPTYSVWEEFSTTGFNYPKTCNASGKLAFRRQWM